MTFDWPSCLDPNGIPEIEPQWLAENAGRVQIVDVREPDEFTGPLGHIETARLVPLATLPDALAQLSRDKPIVAVCRSGGRSARATQFLKANGFEAANLPGGMTRWRREGR